MNSYGLGNCIYKIMRENKVKNKLTLQSGAIFAINVPSKDYKFFLTNNHILDKDFIAYSKELTIYTSSNDKITIDLKINRFKQTDSELDFTIIEILPEDKITNFLEIDDFIKSKDYTNEDIIILHYLDGKNLDSLEGKFIKKKNKYFEYSVNNAKSNSGAPLISKYNLKLLGLFKENHKHKKNSYIDYAFPMDLILSKLNFMKCTFNISKNDIGNKVQIINNGYTDGDKFYTHNNEIEHKIDILIEGSLRENIFTYQFFKEGKHNIYLIQKKNISDMSHMFNQCEKLEEVNLSFFNTADVTDMRHLFAECSSLKKINFSFFSTENVMNMSNMFIGCTSLKKLDLSNFQTENVTNMSYMFSGCTSLVEINISSFNTSSVTDMSYMFAFCNSLKLIDLSCFKTNNVKKINDMFRYSSGLTRINMSSFHSSSIKDMNDIFYGVNSSCKIICDDEEIKAQIPKPACFSCSIF